MTTNIVDFADYQNRTDIENLAVDTSGDDIDAEIDNQVVSALLAMYDHGLLKVTRDENGELLFEANSEATPEQWEEGREVFECMQSA